MKKERAQAFNPKIQITDASCYNDLVPLKHHRMKTNASLKGQDTHLPEIPGQKNIYGDEIRKQRSNVKDDSKPLDSESIYSLKKSATINEKVKSHNTDVGFSPIRMKRNNVLMAYNVNQIVTNNPQA
jgi:hypothetical protein